MVTSSPSPLAGLATATICKETAENSCAQGLQSGSVAHCATRPSHPAAVMSIDEGLVVVNDRWTTVSIDGGPTENITGTYLITFAMVAYVSGSKYVNYNATPDRLPAPAVSTRINITRHQIIASLPYLQKLNEDNLQRIEELQAVNTTTPYLATPPCLLSCIIIAVIAWVYRRRQRNRVTLSVQKVLSDLGMAENAHVLRGGVVKTTGSALSDQQVIVVADLKCQR